MADTYNFDEIKRGEYFEPITFIVKDANGQAIDLTGATLDMLLKCQYRGKEIHNLNPTLSDAVNGEITVPGFVVNLGVYRYMYDLFITLDGEPECYLEGFFPVVESISK